MVCQKHANASKRRGLGFRVVRGPLLAEGLLQHAKGEVELIVQFFVVRNL